MPIVLEIPDLSGRYRLAVWESTESMQELMDLQLLDTDEQLIFNSIKNDKRQREFLTTRRLIRELTGKVGKIIYDTNGRPSLGENGFVSISHTGNLVAVIISATHEVGIDIEGYRNNIDSIAPKFISSHEYADFGEKLSNEAMHLIWGAKEVMFKLYGKGNVDFRNDLRVAPSVTGTDSIAQAYLQKNGIRRDFEISYRRLGTSLLAWSCAMP